MTDLIFSFFPPSTLSGEHTRMDDQREREKEGDRRRERERVPCSPFFFSSLIFEEQDSLLRYFPSHVLAVVAGWLITVSSVVSFSKPAKSNKLDQASLISRQCRDRYNSKDIDSRATFLGHIAIRQRARKNGLELTSCRCIRARMLPSLLHIDGSPFCVCGGYCMPPVLRRATVKYTYATRRMVRVGVVPSEDGS